MYGAYFTKDEKYAKTYEKGKIYPVFLNIKNPLVTEGSWTGVINDASVFEQYDGIINDKFDNGILQKLHLQKSRSEIIIRKPYQVKSATYNTGEFSSTNDDIRYSSITEQPIKVPSVTSFAERLPAQQQPKFASLVARGEISTSCR